MNRKISSFVALVALGSALFLFGGSSTANAKTSTDATSVTTVAKSDSSSTANSAVATDTDSSDVDTTDDDSDDVALTPEEQAALDKQEKDDELNQQATNANTRLQPWYTGSAIALNLSQIMYYITASVSNVVGQGTSIVQTGTNIIGTAISVLKP